MSYPENKNQGQIPGSGDNSYANQYRAPPASYSQQPGGQYSGQQNYGSYSGMYADPYEAAGYKRVNKHLFVWLGAFLLGGFGVDRFMRGQVGLGLAKFFCNWLTLGIWGLVDWIIAAVKAYGEAFGTSEEIVFDPTGAYIR